MSDEITIKSEPEEPEAPKQDDAAFAHGAAVGRYETHMSQSDGRLGMLEMQVAELRARTEQAQQAAEVAVGEAVEANLTATTALIETVATEAENEAAEQTDTEEMPTGEITELEPPTVEVEATEEHHESHKGFWGHLFG